MSAPPLLLTRFSWAPAWCDGTLSFVKWAAMALMVLDHVDAFVFARELTWAGALGRLVFPAFAVVIGYNLARPGMRERGAHGRILRRLVGFGLLALPFHMALASQFGGWWPVNVLFTFAAVVGVVGLVERRYYVAASVLFLAAGAVVEYAWPGIALALSVYWLYRSPWPLPAASVVLCTIGLAAVNGSQLALWSIPLLWLLAHLQLSAPRARSVFYWFYPVHLAVFWLVLSAVGK